MCVCHSYGHRARRASFKQRPHKSAASWLDRGGVHMLIPATRRLDRNESQKQRDAQRPTLMEANMLVRSECDTQNIERNDAKTHIMDMYGDVIFCPPHMNGFFISSQFFAYCTWGICMHLPHEGLLVSIWRVNGPAVEACPANTNV